MDGIFAKRLSNLLTEYNMKQADLAKLSKIRASSISDWCNGKYIPKQDKINKIAKILRTSPAWLLGYDDESVTGTYDNPIFIGQNIKQYQLCRDKLYNDMSPEKLCQKANISMETLSDYENAKESDIDPEIIERIATALGVEVFHIRGYMSPVMVYRDDGTAYVQLNDFSFKFSPRFAGLLKIKGFTDNYFAKRMGINPEEVQSWRLRQSLPNSSLIEKIAKYFGVEVSFLSSDMLSFTYCYVAKKIQAESLMSLEKVKDNLPKIQIPYNFLGKYDGSARIIFMHANVDMEPVIRDSSLMAVLTDVSFSDLEMDDVVVGIYKDSLVLRRFKSQPQDAILAFFAEDPAAAPIYLPAPAEKEKDFHLLGKIVMYCTSL